MTNINSHNFEKLLIWQKAVDLACEIYTLTTNFPQEEKFRLSNQMRRSSVSIASNTEDLIFKINEIGKMNAALREKLRSSYANEDQADYDSSSNV